MTRRPTGGKHGELQVILRFNAHCFMCLTELEEPLVHSSFDRAHLEPLHVGGSDEPANFVLACPTHHRAMDDADDGDNVAERIERWDAERAVLTKDELERFLEERLELCSPPSAMLRRLWAIFRDMRFESVATLQRALICEADALRVKGKAKSAYDLLRNVVMKLGRPEGDLLPLAAVSLSKAILRLGDPDIAIAFAEDAVRASSRLARGPEVHLNAGKALCEALSEAMYFDQRRKWFGTFHQLAFEHRHRLPGLYGGMVAHEASDAYVRGDYRVSTRRYDESQAVLEDVDPTGVAMRRSNKAMILAVHGEAIEAANLLVHAATECASQENRVLSAVNYILAGDARLLLRPSSPSGHIEAREAARIYYMRAYEDLIQTQSKYLAPEVCARIADQSRALEISDAADWVQKEIQRRQRLRRERPSASIASLSFPRRWYRIIPRTGNYWTTMLRSSDDAVG